MLITETAVNQDRALVGAVVAAVRIALDSARLHAGERAHRAGLVDAALAERRRIGRDLHDGVQHRLLVLQGLARRAHGLTTTAPRR